MSVMKPGHLAWSVEKWKCKNLPNWNGLFWSTILMLIEDVDN